MIRKNLKFTEYWMETQKKNLQSTNYYITLQETSATIFHVAGKKKNDWNTKKKKKNPVKEEYKSLGKALNKIISY